LLFSCEQSVLNDSRSAHVVRKQRTLKRSIAASGVGLFTGAQVSLKLCPNEECTGIIFKRVDLPDAPELPARLEFVQATPRCTMIGDGHISIQTVEHLLAALRAYEIDNAIIEITGSEVPVFDGSSLEFVSLIEQAGIAELEETKKQIKLQTPIAWSQGDITLIAIPSDEFRVSYTLHYPHSSFLGTQFYSFVFDQKRFKQEIAPCRTFSIYEEIAPMIEKGLIRGGSLTNAVIIKENKVVNPEGLRFPDEMVRHKVLDLIGDLSLVSLNFLAHVIAVRSGHTSNIAFAKELYNHMKMECSS